MADSLVIEDQDSYEGAGTLWKTLDQNRKLIDQIKRSDIKILDLAHALALENLRAILDPLDDSIEIVKEKRKVYWNEQERIRMAKEAEDSARLRKEQEEEANRVAAELESRGETEAAAVVIQQAISAPAPIVHRPPEVRRQKGTVERWKKTFRILDAAKIKPEFKVTTVDERAINAKVQQLGKAAEEIVNLTEGGISVSVERDESVRQR
jgi:G3E family GTPase